MIAILGGLVAAAMWAASALCISRSTRMIPPVAVLGWVLLIGSVISAPFALAQGVPAELGREQVVLLVVTAIGNTTGLLLVYSSLRFGKVGVVAPITSAQGAAAAVIAVAAGEQIATGAGVALAAIVVGVVLSSMSRTNEAGSDRREGLAIGLAIGAALFFGLGLFAMGRLSEDIPIAWIIFPSRTIAVVFVTIPLAVTGRLRMTREAAPLVVASGLLEVAGPGRVHDRRARRDRRRRGPRVAVRGDRDHRGVRAVPRAPRPRPDRRGRGDRGRVSRS